MKICYSCNSELAIGRGVGRRDVCPSCGANLHSCLNCRFYAPSKSKHCSEPAAELVSEKAGANYCEFFFFSERQPGAGTDQPAEQARKALEDLFKKE